MVRNIEELFGIKDFRIIGIAICNDPSRKNVIKYLKTLIK